MPRITFANSDRREYDVPTPIPIALEYTVVTLMFLGVVLIIRNAYLSTAFAVYLIMSVIVYLVMRKENEDRPAFTVRPIRK